MFTEGHDVNSVERKTLDVLGALSIASEEIEAYGSDPAQFIEWFGPADGELIVFIHGGGFRSNLTLAHARPAALALGSEGYRVALVETRKELGNPNLTWADMCTLAQREDFADALWVGHSLGGTLVLDVVFSDKVPVHRAVVLAPFFSLTEEVEEFGDPTQIANWMGGTPCDWPDTYAQLDPALRYADLGPDGYAKRNLRVRVLQGDKDVTNPAARLRNVMKLPFEIAVIPGANHVDLIRPGHDAWLLLLGALSEA
ncbi:MAG: alpha/beta hydrolase [Actinomycetaceae bacterium]|nr:alpha/beta hydrolase [Actinomycetaceae bacterium]